MRKTFICMLSALSMLQCTTSFAAGSYVAAENKVTVNDSTKKTVIVARNTGTKMVDSDIVYVAQSATGFSSANFLLKANPQVGFYTVMLGGDNGTAERGTFFIGTADKFSERTALTVIDNYEIESSDKSTVTKAYATAGDIDLAKAKSVVVTYGETSACEELGTVGSGEASATIAVNLAGIPAAYKDNVQVYISSTEISTDALINE